MLALKLGMLVLGASFFVFAATLVAYDIFMATRLTRLLAQRAFRRRDRRTVQNSHAARTTIFGRMARARATLPERRPKPLWVARFASQERKS